MFLKIKLKNFKKKIRKKNKIFFFFFPPHAFLKNFKGKGIPDRDYFNKKGMSMG